MWMFLAYALGPDEIGVGTSRLFVDAAKMLVSSLPCFGTCLLGYLKFGSLTSNFVLWSSVLLHYIQ